MIPMFRAGLGVLLLAAFASAEPAPSGDFLIYRDGQSLHLATASLGDEYYDGDLGAQPSDPSDTTEGYDCSIYLKDTRAAFEFSYSFSPSRSEDSLLVRLIQERPSQTIRWEVSGCDGVRFRHARWFCSLDDALCDAEVRQVLGALLHRLHQPPRILTSDDIRHQR